jgi:Flp pilus assembly protein TadD
VLLSAAQAAPQVASLQYNLAVVAVAQGEVAEAVARCRRALELDPSHAGAAELLGRIGGGAAAR